MAVDCVHPAGVVAEQELTFVPDHVRVDELPLGMDVGLEERVTEAIGFTVKVFEPELLPFALEQIFV